MKERGILFNGEMVRAEQAGRKTQTRRVMKPQPEAYDHVDYDEKMGWHIWWDKTGHNPWDVEQRYKAINPPYGQPGDRLWVRETWGFGCRNTEHGALDGLEYRADQFYLDGEFDDLDLYPVPDDADEESVERWMNKTGWHPSIHMPRWASRTILELIAVRVERLQDISEEDAIAEGALHDPPVSWVDKPIVWFSRLWNSIAKPGEQWDDNPYVWAYEFRRVE